MSSPVIAPNSTFYSQPELHPKSVKFSNLYLTSQFFDISHRQHQLITYNNKFDPLIDDLDTQDEFKDTMEIDSSSTSNLFHTSSPGILKKTVTWSTDSGIEDISAVFFLNLNLLRLHPQLTAKLRVNIYTISPLKTLSYPL